MAKSDTTDRDEERRKRLVPDQTPPGAAPAEAASGPLEPYHVRGPGSVFAGGKSHAVGESLMLTDEDALSLGDAVAPGHVAPSSAAASPGGTYRLTQIGSILKDGKYYQPGETIELTAEESVSFADRIERA